MSFGNDSDVLTSWVVIAVICAGTAACLAAAAFCGALRNPSVVALHHAPDGFAGSRSARLLESTRSLKEYHASPVLALLGGIGSSILLNGCRRPRPLKWTLAQDVRLPDGGMLRLQWLLHNDTDSGSLVPLGTLVVVPGTRGTADSAYVIAMARAAFARGWDVVVAPLRGCGVGGSLATPHCLDGVHWTDLVYVMQAIHEALPPAPDPRHRLCAVGYSMGGGMLANYVAELGPGCPFEAAVAVSATADYAAITEHMRTSRLGWLMERILVHLMQRDMRPNVDVFAGTDVSVPLALSARSLHEWQAAVTCRLRGFATPADFVASVSFTHALRGAVSPLLFIGAEGDPICPAGTTPPQAEGSVILARTSRGGHIAFPAGPAWPLPFGAPHAEDWDTVAALEFCEAALRDADLHGCGRAPLPESGKNDRDGGFPWQDGAEERRAQASSGAPLVAEQAAATSGFGTLAGLRSRRASRSGSAARRANRGFRSSADRSLRQHHELPPGTPKQHDSAARVLSAPRRGRRSSLRLAVA